MAEGVCDGRFELRPASASATSRAERLADGADGGVWVVPFRAGALQRVRPLRVAVLAAIGFLGKKYGKHRSFVEFEAAYDEVRPVFALGKTGSAILAFVGA